VACDKCCEYSCGFCRINYSAKVHKYTIERADDISLHIRDYIRENLTQQMGDRLIAGKGDINFKTYLESELVSVIQYVDDNADEWINQNKADDMFIMYMDIYNKIFIKIKMPSLRQRISDILDYQYLSQLPIIFNNGIHLLVMDVNYLSQIIITDLLILRGTISIKHR
jgi:hypothetical protein